MRKFGKNTIAQTFKFECDRFLRFQLSTLQEKVSIDIKKFDALGYIRKGVELMAKEGHKWETEMPE